MDFFQLRALCRWYMFPEKLLAAARVILEEARKRGLLLATAESCTAGLISACIAQIPGSSSVLERGFVTYSNEAKTELLGVSAALIAAHGAVSAEVARAMAEGALAGSRAAIAVSCSGIAGPDGGSAAKPVGLVHMAAVRRGGQLIHAEQRFGDIGRTQVQLATVAEAFVLLRQVMD